MKVIACLKTKQCSLVSEYGLWFPGNPWNHFREIWQVKTIVMLLLRCYLFFICWHLYWWYKTWHLPKHQSYSLRLVVVIFFFTTQVPKWETRQHLHWWINKSINFIKSPFSHAFCWKWLPINVANDKFWVFKLKLEFYYACVHYKPDSFQDFKVFSGEINNINKYDFWYL